MLNEDGKQIDELYNRYWHDPYLRLLSISDHLTECKLKYEAYKLDSINKDLTKEQLRHELDKELMDLFVLLLLQLWNDKDMNDLLEKRVQRFKEKLEPMEKR